jgi:class I fructose-bisphosphate aldolase
MKVQSPPAKAAPRTRLADLDLGSGKRTRLHRLLFGAGPANGRLLIIPIDQGLEHGPIDFLPNPPSADPRFQWRLAHEGGFSAIAAHVGLAEKYHGEFAGRLPLILKLNGKTNIPPDRAPVSPLTASVEDAVRLGADAVGYTLYVGSPAQDQDILQFNHVRAEAQRLGMPVIVWAYPRGEALQAKGGNNTLYAVDYAARVACELGADVVKLNIPSLDPEKNQLTPEPYRSMRPSEAEAIARVVQSAGRALVIFAGGGRVEADTLVHSAEMVLAQGATGLIFGRNLWQRPWDEALALAQRLREVIQRHPA